MGMDIGHNTLHIIKTIKTITVLIIIIPIELTIRSIALTFLIWNKID
jgi:hypothetical protein